MTTHTSQNTKFTHEAQECKVGTHNSQNMPVNADKYRIRKCEKCKETRRMLRQDVEKSANDKYEK